MPRGTAAPTTSTTARTKRRALACLVAVWVAFVFPIFFGRVHFPSDFVKLFFAPAGSKPTFSSNLVDTDVYLQEYPWHAAVGKEIAAGHLPLWDASRFAGAPLAADISAGTFYPPNWLYAVAPNKVETVSTIIWAATIALSLLLVYWLLSLLRLHPYAAALGAVVWTFSGFMVSEGMFDALVGAVVWLPMALAGLELARQGKPRRGIPIAGLALALAVLAGHVQIALYVWLAVGVWAVIAALAAAAGARSAGAVVRELMRGMAPTAVAFAIGAGLASIQILGTLEYAGQIIRQQETIANASFIHIAPRNLPTMLIPDYLGNSLDGTYAGWLGFAIETTIYAGVVTLPLAIAGLAHRNRRLATAFGGLAALGLAAALGGPAFRFLFAVVPGVSRTRDITRFKLLLDFGLAGLAALGLDAALSRRNGVAVCAGMVSAAALVVGLIAMTAARWGTVLPAHYITPKGVRAILLTVGCLGLLLVIARLPRRAGSAALVLIGFVALDLWLFGFGYHPFQPKGSMYPTSPAVAYLTSVSGTRPRFALVNENALPVNSAMVYGLFSVNGYDPFIPGTFVSLMTQVQDDVTAWAVLGNTIPPVKVGSVEPPIFDLLGVQTVATPGIAGTAVGPGISIPTGSQEGSVALFDEPQAQAPAFLATCWVVQPDDIGLALLKNMSSSEIASTAVVSAGPQAEGLGTSGARCPAGPSLATTRYSGEDVEVSVPQASPGGVMVLTDQWFPGWTMTVDGKPKPILRVDEALRGVALGSGAHTVRFVYRPRWPVLGLAIVVFTLAVTGLLALAPRKASSRPPVRGK